MALTFDALRDDYALLWRTMAVRLEKVSLADRSARKILANRERYRAVEQKTNVPWFMIGAIHALECGLSFAGHLHNGDPLTARTRQVPQGRPAFGEPPFTWEQSALDSLTMPPHSLHRVAEWTIERIAYELERYNGFGYRRFHPGVKSPYLWSYSSHYAAGKYVADGQWSPTAVSTQCGAVVLIKRLAALDASVAERLTRPAVIARPPGPQSPAGPPPPDIEPPAKASTPAPRRPLWRFFVDLFLGQKG
jgi:lysozyme family protein